MPSHRRLHLLAATVLCVAMIIPISACSSGPEYEEQEDWSACPWAPDGYVYPDHDRRKYVNLSGEARSDSSFLGSMCSTLIECLFSGK